MHLLTQFALGRRSVILLLMVFVLLVGAWSWSTMPNELFPSVEATTVKVVTFLPGSNPDAMVADVTEEIEEVLVELEDIEDVDSRSFDTKSIISANFLDGTNMDDAKNDVIAAVSGVDLPDLALEPIVQVQDPALVPIIYISVLPGDRSIPELQRILDDFVIPAIDKVEGTFTVDLLGEVDEEIVIEVDLDKLEDLNITLAQVSNALGACLGNY